MAKLFANCGDLDQAPHSAASDLGVHCLPVTLLRVSRLQWVKSFLASGYFCHLLITFANSLDSDQAQSFHQARQNVGPDLESTV